MSQFVLHCPEMRQDAFDDVVEPELDGFHLEEIADPADDFIRFIFQGEAWMDDAACRAPDVDWNWFFPKRGQSLAKGKEVCARCPVGAQCDEYADRSYTEHGMWNGTMRKKGQRPKYPRKKKTDGAMQSDVAEDVGL